VSPRNPTRSWSDRRYVRKWGLPADSLDPALQQRVAAALRCDAVITFGLSDVQWADFTETHWMGEAA
jgi:hypothetical protein